jgi:glycosyltransferase 2 family protein
VFPDFTDVCTLDSRWMIRAHSQQRSGGWLLIILRWAAALVVLGALLHFLPLGPLRQAIARVPVSTFFAVLLGYLLAHCVGVAKWRMVVNAAGAGLDFATSARCYFGGLFGTLFLPSIVGGDVVRLAVGLQRSPRPAAVLAGNVVDRFLDVLAQTGLVVLGLLLVPELELAPETMEDTVTNVLLGAACGSIVLLGLLFLLRRRILGGRSVRFRRRLARLRLALRAVSKRPSVLALGWLLGTCVQLAFVVLTAQLAVRCGLTLPLRAWLFAWPLAKVAAVLPITQGGIGVREAALVALLSPLGAPGHLVLAAGLVWEGVVVAGGLIAGVAAVMLQRRGADSA